jgi:hypothetical protein
MASPQGGGIFVSYRRQEESHLVGRLYDNYLVDHFGEDRVFVDVDTIKPGMNFAAEIIRAVTACQVLLVIIGPAWLTAADKRGRRRLDDPDDFVRLEIGTGLATHGVSVIPVLADGAAMPSQHDLPGDLASLAPLQALTIRYESFHNDAGRLIKAIERVLETLRGPGRNETAPVAQLLANAEHAADSITDASSKAQALSGIAQALVAINPDRAARLFDDIESIANSTGPYYKAQVLSRLAQALAATDPDRAEYITNSIAEEYLKAQPLSGIAQALAATDPDRAERITNSIAHAPLKAQALSDIAQVLKATDPDRAARLFDDAESIANSTGPYLRARALSNVAEVLVATDPDRAARLFDDAESVADSLTDASSKTQALSTLAQALAATDPDRAKRIADSITHAPSKPRSLISVVRALAPSEPNRSGRLLNSVTDASLKAQALSGIALALTATDPDRAARLFDDAESIADSISDAPSKASALTGVARALTAGLS